MADYLVDFYSADGTLYKSEKISTTDDDEAVREASHMADRAKAATYRVIQLEKSGNRVIHGFKPMKVTVRPAAGQTK
jgi:hypothetical protein